jgi:von Willebrand factor type A domain
MTPRDRFAGGVCIGLLAVLVACSGKDEGSTFGSGNGSGSGGGGTGGGAGSSSISDSGADRGGLISGNADSSRGGVVILEDGEVCAGEDFSVVAVPFDMFIMLDQSQSMTDKVGNGTRWSAVTSAITGFIGSPEAAAMGVGLQYFPLKDPQGGLIAPDSCDAAQYAMPDVEIGPLSDAAVRKALTDSIAAHHPQGFTPTAAALQGALDHARMWAGAHPDRPTIVVLATDGQPTECMPTDGEEIADTIVAPALAADPSVRTFVIGVGSSLFTLNTIAQKGGTGRATLVADSAATSDQVKTALLSISHVALACSYTLPVPDGGIQPDRVNLVFTPAGGAPRLLPILPQGQLCSSAGGWYFDDSKAPTKVLICQQTCADLANGKLEIKVGCPTQSGPTN